MPDGLEKDRAVDTFIIQLGRVYASKRASIRVLADTIGVNYSTLKSQMHDRRIVNVPPATYDGIERVLGLEFRFTPRGLWLVQGD